MQKHHEKLLNNYISAYLRKDELAMSIFLTKITQEVESGRLNPENVKIITPYVEASINN